MYQLRGYIPVDSTNLVWVLRCLVALLDLLEDGVGILVTVAHHHLQHAPAAAAAAEAAAPVKHSCSLSSTVSLLVSICFLAGLAHIFSYYLLTYLHGLGITQAPRR
jgi:hypothetical protein